ncbi:hypothetical protein ARMGADRAFT_1087389 [Armillaria gallica]|uniref:Protein argonaute N-terminal domain-containing protein n=1 Tax=Armillaria gallica TaxID=47427 RepID=A0A2H3CUI0_ARMGA|nr:hypothetical protein ARMGADRAFT_1087389 [Armillaria gallica]
MAPGQRGGTPFLIPAPQQSGVPSRGRGGGRGGVAGPQGSPSVSVSSTVQAVGVPRPGFGNAGRQINIRVNTSAMNIPDITVYHYDAVENSDRADSKMQLIKALQSQYPGVFIRAAVYDGNNNLYTSYKLNFGTELSRQFDVTWTDGDRASNSKITVTEAREINMDVLRRYTTGLQSWDENVSTALSALNIVLRMG